MAKGIENDPLVEHYRKGEDKELVPSEGQVVRVLMRGDQMNLAIMEYKELQNTLDKAMPDCIMEIQGRQFRKKNYWRAVRTAFGLSVEQTKEERIITDDDWGYIVTYRAMAPSGNYADGDGSCMASEKSKGRMTATEHNVRSHAHTRSFNRAVSNLVGFGEVSAEEMEYSDRHEQSSYHDRQSETVIRPPANQALKFGNGQPKDQGGLTKAHLELKEIVEKHIKESEPDVKPEQIYITLTKYDSYAKKDSRGEPVMVKDARTGKMVQQTVAAFQGQPILEKMSETMAGVAVGKYRKMMKDAEEKAVKE